MLTEAEINSYNTRTALLRQVASLSGLPKGRWTKCTDEQLEANIRSYLKKAGVIKERQEAFGIRS